MTAYEYDDDVGPPDTSTTPCGEGSEAAHALLQQYNRGSLPYNICQWRRDGKVIGAGVGVGLDRGWHSGLDPSWYHAHPAASLWSVVLVCPLILCHMLAQDYAGKPGINSILTATPPPAPATPAHPPIPTHPLQEHGQVYGMSAMLYECGPAWGCTHAACPQRRAPLGVRHRLEVFMTPGGARGWGVRAWDCIPSGAVVAVFYGRVVS